MLVRIVLWKFSFSCERTSYCETFTGCETFSCISRTTRPGIHPGSLNDSIRLNELGFDGNEPERASSRLRPKLMLSNRPLKWFNWFPTPCSVLFIFESHCSQLGDFISEFYLKDFKDAEMIFSCFFISTIFRFFRCENSDSLSKIENIYVYNWI